ncbi:MAG: ABC transporter ATP-binding protein [Asgard group archaeon]|nr:ABC transporter ATP-binding protein [Asgard group archaeon]
MNNSVSLNQVTFKYKNNSTFAIKNISLDISIGDFVLLVGYSGSGKSTLLKTMNGLIPHFHAGLFGGKVLINGEDIIETNTAHLSKKVGFVFQNPENQLSALTVEREIAFPMENFGYPRRDIISRVDELIELMDLEDIRNKSPFSISGGEQQLTAIAAALALDPQIIILDEVTAHLSPMSSYKVLVKLTELNKKLNKTIILSEHRLDRCIHFANKMIYLENGLLKAEGKINDVLNSECYPNDLLPKIPKLYFKFREELIQANQNKKIQTYFESSNIPLIPEDFIMKLKDLEEL